MAITAETIIKALSGLYDVRSYSGRFMFGKQCVGIDIPNMGVVMGIAADLVDAGCTPSDVVDLGDRMESDGMGRGMIVYWSHLELTAEQIASLGEEEEDEA